MKNENSQDGHLSRRNFSKLTMAAFGGLAAGSVLGVSKRSFAADDEASLLLSGKNVCRGLNHSCANHKDGDNKCAGTGACATAAAHTCGGANECKGEGGCKGTAGENACKGKGGCAVPLKAKAWTATRAKFEKAMTAAGKKFGDAPAAG